MSAHTVGPWIAQPDPDARGSDDYVIGIGDGAPIDYVATCSKRDARLIAAAPELLGQHEANLADLDFLLRAIGAGDPMPELAIRVSDLIRHTQAAIAKATQP